MALSALDYWQLVSGRCSRLRMKRAVAATNIPFSTVPLSLAVVYFIFLVWFVLVFVARNACLASPPPGLIQAIEE
jgi:hypothetical protein